MDCPGNDYCRATFQAVPRFDSVGIRVAVWTGRPGRTATLPLEETRFRMSEQPHSIVSKTSRHWSLSLCLAASLAAPSAALADRFASLGSGWQKYSNDLHGTEFEFPASTFTVTPAAGLP